MLVKNFLSKTLNTASVLAVSSTLLTMTFTTSSWAMEQEEEPTSQAVTLTLPKELLPQVIRNVSRLNSPFEPERSLRGQRYATFHELWSCYLVSHSWNDAAKQVIIEDKLLTIRLLPNNYESLPEGIAFLTTDISFPKKNSHYANLDKALKKHAFPHALSLSYTPGPSTLSSELLEAEVRSLISCFPNFVPLQELRLFVKIEENCAAALGEALPFLPNLEKLIVWAELGPIGTQSLAEGLTNHRKLNFINLCQNGVGDMGLTAIAKKLPILPSLGGVYMDGTPPGAPHEGSAIVGPGGKAYFEMMAKKHLPDLGYKF